jgi:orotate phosphoribosyltransferase/AMMECR1 domain-containing protein
VSLADRAALAALLREQGFLVASADQPLRRPDGSLAPWALYSWNVSLTAEGLRLAAACLLERLAGFRATQIASIGYTGLPLLAACVLMGQGRYRGLAIRERPKAYLSGRQMEGPFDPHEPVVILDDSIHSGASLAKAIRAVEAAGGEVEGALALVGFGRGGGLAWANGAGYPTQALFDVWTDLGMAASWPVPPSPAPPPEGGLAAPEGLDPASLARFAARTWLESGRAPRPPKALDRPHRCDGGVFVSLRERGSERRLARDGFWHFDLARADPPCDVIAATVQTLRTAASPIGPQDLGGLKIAVTFFSALEPIGPSGLDFSRYGIVARSRVFPGRVGGALPNTQVFISEVEQYRQARVVNARIEPGEPHDLFRHEVAKHVEPSETWLPYGVAPDERTAWASDAAFGARLAARARFLLAQALGSAQAPAAPAVETPAGAEGVGLRLYGEGLLGQGLALGTDLDAALAAAAAQAAADPRASAAAKAGATLVVSVLHHAEPLGAATPAHLAWKLRRGLDALGARGAGEETVLLPGVLVYNSLSPQAFVDLAARRAGPAAGAAPLAWRTLQCAEWLDAGAATLPLRFGFAQRGQDPAAPVDAAGLARLLAGHVGRSLGPDGLPRYQLEPGLGAAQARGTAARALHGLMALAGAAQALDEPAWRTAARRGLAGALDRAREGRLDLPGWDCDSLAEAVLLDAAARDGELAPMPGALALARRLAALVQPSGRIGARRRSVDAPQDHDFRPGALLAGLARFARTTRWREIPDLAPSVAWLGRRFEACPGWGSAGWLPQAMAQVHALTGERSAAALAFAASDWAIERQLACNGAFLEDLVPDEPSFDTAFVAEGLAASLALATQLGEGERAARYRQGWTAAINFMTRLIVFPQDVFALAAGTAAGTAAVGGVRQTQCASTIRIDQVSHTLHALTSGLAAGAILEDQRGV